MSGFNPYEYELLKELDGLRAEVAELKRENEKLSTENRRLLKELEFAKEETASKWR